MASLYQSFLQERPVYPELTYSEALIKVKPLDLLVFDKWDFSSFLIVKAQELSRLTKAYTHSAIVVTRELLPDLTILEPGQLYVLESTSSSSPVTPPDLVKGKISSGIQIRELRAVIQYYQTYQGGQVIWCPLKDNPFLTEPKVKKRLSRTLSYLVKQHHGRDFDFNTLTLLNSGAHWFRPYNRWLNQDYSQHQLNPDKREVLFCSEFVCLVYQRLGILPMGLIAHYVSPVDLLGCSPKADSLCHWRYQALPVIHQGMYSLSPENK